MTTEYQISRSHINPFTFNKLKSSELTGKIISENEVIVDGDIFRLIDCSFPFTLIGEEVVVYLNRNIFCKTLKDVSIEKKQKEKEDYNKKMETFKAEFEQNLLSPVESFDVKSRNYKDTLSFFESVCDSSKSAYNLYRRHWGSWEREIKDKSMLKMEVADNAKALLISKIHNEFTLEHHSAYAYSPQENVNSGGKYHIILNENLTSGRFKHQRGDALCKPKKNFWGLQELEEKSVNCHNCVKKMIRIIHK